MEKVSKTFPLFVWFGVQTANLAIIASCMLAVLRRFHWNLYVGGLLGTCFGMCLLVFYTVWKMTREATPERKLDGQWLLIQLMMLVGCLLMVPLMILN